MQARNIKLVYEFLVIVISSILFYGIFSAIFNLFNEIIIEISFGGCKSNVLFGLFFGLPIGNVLGLLLFEKFIFKIKEYNILAILSSSILSIIAVVFCIFLLDILGGKTIVFVPVIVSTFAIVGYKTACHF